MTVVSSVLREKGRSLRRRKLIEREGKVRRPTEIETAAFDRGAASAARLEKKGSE